MKTITINKNFFEHLLACLANQKYIREINADGFTDESIDVEEEIDSNQYIIDAAWSDGMALLEGKENVKYNYEALNNQSL